MLSGLVILVMLTGCATYEPVTRTRIDPPVPVALSPLPPATALSCVTDATADTLATYIDRSQALSDQATAYVDAIRALDIEAEQRLMETNRLHAALIEQDKAMRYQEWSWRILGAGAIGLLLYDGATE